MKKSSLDYQRMIFNLSNLFTICEKHVALCHNIVQCCYVLKHMIINMFVFNCLQHLENLSKHSQHINLPVIPVQSSLFNGLCNLFFTTQPPSK